MVLAHQQTLICRAALLSLLHASKQVRCTMQRRPWPWPCRLHAASPPAQVAASAAVAATGCEQLAAAPAGGWHLMAHHGTVGHLALAGERGSCAGRSWHGGHAARGSTARPAGRARCSGLRTGGRRSAGHRIRGAGPGSKAVGHPTLSLYLAQAAKRWRPTPQTRMAGSTHLMYHAAHCDLSYIHMSVRLVGPAAPGQPF
jgi:hypothetical protein